MFQSKRNKYSSAKGKYDRIQPYDYVAINATFKGICLFRSGIFVDRLLVTFVSINCNDLRQPQNCHSLIPFDTYACAIRISFLVKHNWRDRNDFPIFLFAICFVNLNRRKRIIIAFYLCSVSNKTVESIEDNPKICCRNPNVSEKLHSFK